MPKANEKTEDNLFKTLKPQNLKKKYYHKRKK